MSLALTPIVIRMTVFNILDIIIDANASFVFPPLQYREPITISYPSEILEKISGITSEK
jgi:hypothetical protein